MDESQMLRVSVEEAAALLGIEKGSVKKRIQRGKLRSEKDARGTTWVYVDRSETVRDESQGRSATYPGELVEELRDRVRYLERALQEEREARTDERRRHDTLMAQLMSRIPEIEAPPEPPAKEPETATEGPVEPTPSEPAEGPQEGAEPRSWWRRVFGG